MKRVFLALSGLLAALALLAGCKDPVPGNPAPRPSQTCLEDQDCWDCATMGNRRCGPEDPKVKA